MEEERSGPGHAEEQAKDFELAKAGHIQQVKAKIALFEIE